MTQQIREETNTARSGRRVLAAGLSTWLLLAASGAGQEGAGSSPYQLAGSAWTNRFDSILAFMSERGQSFLSGVQCLSGGDYLSGNGAGLDGRSLSFDNVIDGLSYRLEVGEISADLSRRTLKREVRGLSLRLKPGLGWGNHSLLLVSGVGKPSWGKASDGAAEGPRYQGVGYVFSSPRGRVTLGANFVAVDQDPQGAVGSSGFGDDHQVASLYGKARFGHLVWEAEMARLTADRGVDETSFYAQVARGNKPLSWRLRYEDNSEGFDPTGAVAVVADRRSGELDARWAPGGRGTLSARLRHIENGVEGPTPQTDTDLLALSYERGPLKDKQGFRFHLSGEAKNIATEDVSVERLSLSYRLELEHRSRDGFQWSYAAKYRETEDKVLATGDSSLSDQSLSLARSFGVSGRFKVKGGVACREQSKSAAYESWSLPLEFSATSARHRVSLHLSARQKDFVSDTRDDLRHHSQRLSYSFLAGPHTLTLDVDHHLRLPDKGTATDSLRVGIKYRGRFGKVG